MRIEAEDGVAHLLIKAAHHADDDDEHRDAQRHAEHGNQGDDRNERALGPQVTQRQQQFKRESRHARKLDSRCVSVNERRE